MELDIKRRFGDIYKSKDDFRRSLFQLQQYKVPREGYCGWADRLRFLTLPDVPGVRNDTADLVSEENESSNDCNCYGMPNFSDLGDTRTLLLTEQGDCQGCKHYAAVSYCWPQHGEAQDVDGSDRKYTVLTKTGERASRAPAHVLERAIAYAGDTELSFIWIDQECIWQDDEDDKERGIQSMDLVYQRSAHPIGLLNAVFNSRESLDILEQLIEGREIEMKNMEDLADFLELLNEDLWFTRTWILQESTAGGLDMQLLARHDIAFEKPESLGTIPGEVQISITELHEAIGWAQECIDTHRDALRPALLQRLEAAMPKSWNLCPTHTPRLGQNVNDPDYRQTCNAAQALNYMADRNNSRVADRLAILSNLCDYGIRIDTSKVEKTALTFTVSALALGVFNGDLSMMGDHTAALSDRLAYSWGPLRQGTLSKLAYVEEDEDIVRLRPSHITNHGLAIEGFLWHMDRQIDCQDIKSTYESRWNTTKVEPHEIYPTQSSKAQFLRAEIIWHLLRRLVHQGHLQLANAVWHCSNRWYLGPRHLLPGSRGKVLIPSRITDVIDPSTNEFIYSEPPFVESEADFREFFPGDTMVSWVNCGWVVDTIMQEGRLICGHVVGMDPSSENSPIDEACDALFDVPHPGGHVFTPFIRGARLRHIAATRRRPPISRVVAVEEQEECGYVLRGGELVRGYWNLHPRTTSKTYALL